MSGYSDDAETAPDIPDTPDLPDAPDEPDAPLDTGASFATTNTGVQIEVGGDATGSLAVIYDTDTKDRSDPDAFLDAQEARFYLGPKVLI